MSITRLRLSVAVIGNITCQSVNEIDISSHLKTDTAVAYLDIYTVMGCSDDS